MSLSRDFGSHPRPVGRAIAARRLQVLGDPTEFMGTNGFGRPEASCGTVAVISDIHGNLPALLAVLSAIEVAGITRIWCLGDTVGYGASPIECLRLVRERCELVLAGNHDLAAVGDEPLALFGRHARSGIEHARRELEIACDGAVLREWLALRLTEVTDARRSAGFDLTVERQLNHHREDSLRYQRIIAAHAAPSPWDSVWDYVGVDVSAATLASEFSVPIILVGHSHRQFVHTIDEVLTTPGSLVQMCEPAEFMDDPMCISTIVANPGSVGQPRDRNPNAAWIAYDEQNGTVSLHRTAYDVDAAIDAMNAVGLPSDNAERLRTGQ